MWKSILTIWIASVFSLGSMVQAERERRPSGEIKISQQQLKRLKQNFNNNKFKYMRQISEYRRQQGVSSKRLKWNRDFERAARQHALDLSRGDLISHYGSDDSNPWDRVEKIFKRNKRKGFLSLVAENVGTGQKSFAEVFRGWKNSMGHNRNLLLQEATEAGLYLVVNPKADYKTFWVLILGRVE